MSKNFQIREPIVLIELAHELEPVESVAEDKLAYRAAKVNKSNGPNCPRKKAKIGRASCRERVLVAV